MSPASFVHLVGSIHKDTAEEAMRCVCESIPHRFYRIPDGETGIRDQFVLWQVKTQKIWPPEVLAEKPGWQNIAAPGESRPKFDLKKQDLPKMTGYGEAALASYKVFCSQRDAGVIPSGVKFQVCLPSPTTVVGLLVHPDYQLQCEQFYEEMLHADLQLIQATIPHHDLAIQWDVLAELAFLEHAHGHPRETNDWFFGQLLPFFTPVRDGIAARMARLALPIAPGVDMGLHLCYGDAKQKHFVQPNDTAFLAEVITAALTNMSHPVSWAHLPVPKDRTDEAYFAPLKAVELGETSLVLGLVHAHDDAGTKQRLAAAQKVLPGVSFGIATECGLGRRDQKDMESILQICKDNSVAH